MLIDGRYRLEEYVGSGGQGEIWRAREEGSAGSVWALKFLLPNLAMDQVAVGELANEILHCKKIGKHPGIISIDGLVIDRRARRIAMKMEFASGGTISARRMQRPYLRFEPEEIHEWFRQLCGAIDHAHRAGVVHRDVKPSNLLLDENDGLKLADFGIARAIRDGAIRQTNTQDFVGSAWYASPEQLRGYDEHPADDLYALGATIYELLTGEPPYRCGRQALLDRHLDPEDFPPSIGARRQALGQPEGSIPPDWEEVLSSLLAKRAEDRPSTAGEVATRLALGGPAPTAVPVASVVLPRRAFSPAAALPVADLASTVEAPILAERETRALSAEEATALLRANSNTNVTLLTSVPTVDSCAPTQASGRAPVGYGRHNARLLRESSWLDRVLRLFGVDISRKRILRQVLGDRVSTKTFYALLNSSVPLNLEGEQRGISIFVCEIFNHDDLEASLSAPDYVALTNSFRRNAADFLVDRGGYLDECDGESLRVVFGAPLADPDHARVACEAALALTERLDEVNAECHGVWKQMFDFRIGVNSGDMVIAAYGSNRLGTFSVAGEPVEFARRLCRANLIYGSRILLGVNTFNPTEEKVEVRPMELIQRYDDGSREEIYELLALRDVLSFEDLERRDLFWQGVICYREQLWDEALGLFHSARSASGADGPVEFYIRRTEQLRAGTPALDWISSRL